MPSDRFQTAAARGVVLPEVWSTLRPSERAAAIYRELHKLDAESASESEQAEAPVAGPKSIG
jgi:hypothetical protein